MLERLDSIDWSKLTHAYGEASDVPDVLHQLKSDDADERQSALSTLQSSIWHQGTVYEATAYVVPFVIELLAAPTAEGKADLLIFLSLCANGNSYQDVHQDLIEKEAKTDEWKAQLEKELVWVRRAREAVFAGRHLYSRHLAHAEADVREAAGFLLATLDQPSPETALALWSQFERETDERCRATLLIGFGRVASPTAANTSLLLDAFLKSQSRPERLAAALALAQVSPAELAQEAAQEILNAIYDSSATELLDGSPWDVHGIELIIEGALLRLEGAAAAFVVCELEKTLADAGHPVALNAAVALLSLAFREPLPKEATMESLGDFQRRVIQLMAINKNAWVKSMAGAPANEPKEAVVFRSRATDLALERLCCEAALRAGTFPQKPRSLWESPRRRTSSS